MDGESGQAIHESIVVVAIDKFRSPVVTVVRVRCGGWAGEDRTWLSQDNSVVVEQVVSQ